MSYPGNRFWATIAAQAGSVFLLFFIGIIFDIGAIRAPCPSVQPGAQVEAVALLDAAAKAEAVEVGVQVIFVIALLVFIGLVVGSYRGFKDARDCGGEFIESCVEKTVTTFLIFDIPLLTILVCLEGGLTRSMFSPLFGLIPLAHYAVERRRKDRVLKDILAVVIGIIISFLVSIFITEGKIWGWVTVTDFSSIARRQYALAILFVTLVSIMILILQMRLIRIPKTRPKSRRPPEDDRKSPLQDQKSPDEIGGG